MNKNSTSLRLGFSKMEITVVVGVILILTALILPAIQQARESAWRTQSRNNLMQLGLALHNYHDVFSTFPPGGTVLVDDRSYHGWFTQLGPYLDASTVPSQIDYHRPWDDRVNQHLFQQLHPVALNPSVALVATEHGFGLNHYSGNPAALHRNSSVALEDFALGTNHGWVLGEVVGNFEPWGSPFNWRAFDKPLNSGNDSFGRGTGGAHFLMGDGSVRFVSDDANEHAQITFSGGLPTPSPKQIERPTRVWKYRTGDTGITTRMIPLDELDWEGLALMVYYDLSGVPQTASIRPRGKWSDRSPTIEDLQQVDETCPNVRILLADVAIDEETSRLLSQLPELKVVRVPTVSMTPEVIDNLKRLNNLEELIIGGVDPDLLPALRSQLSGVLIDVKSRP